MYAVTIWPAWVGFSIGLVPTLLAWRGSARAGRWLVIGWVLFLGAFAEEPCSLARTPFSAAPDSSAIKVVSLNCAGGDPLAAAEALARVPELVLLQESPSEPELSKLAGGQWSLVAGPDASILARGRLERLKLPHATTNFTAARWTRLAPAGSLYVMYVVSLRLTPPVFRLDYWNPACWGAYSANKRNRRVELDQIVAFLHTLPDDATVIVGGDFNTPPDRWTQAKLRAGFTDCFAESGRGWGATGVNEIPMVRIDQIWHRGGVSTAARAIKTEHSDHRMVEAVLALQ